MPTTTKTDVIIADIFNEAIAAEFAGKGAFMGSSLVASGAAVVDGSFPGGANAIGDAVKVPYFGTMGDFVANADGTAAVPQKISQMTETATVSRDSLAFEASRWSRNSVGGDAYQESAAQIMKAAVRAMDLRVINAATAAGGLIRNAFSATVPRLLDYDLITDAKMLWGDEQDDIAAMVVHSRTLGDLYRLRDANGKPFLTDMPDGQLPRFLGMPIVVSDRTPLTGSTMSSVTASGTSPPTVTLSGTPNFAGQLQIDIVVGGTLGTATFRFSTDGGQNWSATIATAASVPLIDTAVDSLVGANGLTGVTAAFAAGTYNADNLYVATPQLQVRTLLLKRNSLAFWYNRAALALATDRDILKDTELGAIHLYAAAIRYRRRPGGTKPGVIQIVHNVG